MTTGTGQAQQPRLRLVGPDELPAPVTDELSLTVVTDAVEALARLRAPYWLGDTGIHLHALAGLLAQAHALLPEAIHAARDHDLTWTEIGQLLGLTAETAATDHTHDQLDRDHPHNAAKRP
jgi:hypothetical protein